MQPASSTFPPGPRRSLVVTVSPRRAAAGRRTSCAASASLPAARMRSASPRAVGAGRLRGTFQPLEAHQSVTASLLPGRSRP
jgi:hypothetical protein